MKRSLKGVSLVLILTLFGCGEVEESTVVNAEVEEVALEEAKQAEEKAKQEEADKASELAKAEADKKAKADAKRAKEEAKQKEVDEILALFPELEAEIVKITDGVITEINAEYLTSYFKVDIYVDETTWAYSSESEKQSFATSFGNMIVNRIPINTIVDFRSALNRDIVAEGKVFGGYDIKR